MTTIVIPISIAAYIIFYAPCMLVLIASKEFDSQAEPFFLAANLLHQILLNITYPYL